MDTYKVGDRVKLIGAREWNNRIKKDIGLVGVVEDVYASGSIRISIKNSVSGNKHWIISGNKGIRKEEGQMLFSFMYD